MKISIFLGLIVTHALELYASDRLVNAQDVAAAPYKFTPEEVKALLQKRQTMRAQASESSSHTFFPGTSQSSTNPSIFDDVKLAPDFKGYCEAKGVKYETYKGSQVKLAYRFNMARCLPGLGPKQYIVTCDQYRRVKQSRHDIPGNLKPGLFLETCPEKYTCHNVDSVMADGTTNYSIICVEDPDVKVEWIHEAEAIPGSPTTGLMHCAKDEWVPSASYPAAPMEGLSLVVTEEALYPNGSAYKSPSMRIHDKTSPFPYNFDRVWRRNVNVASALIVLAANHGRLQQKRLQFCFEIVKQRREFFVVFVYSWIIAKHRRGTIPELGFVSDNASLNGTHVQDQD